MFIPFCDWRLEHRDILWCQPSEAPFNQLPLAPIDFSQKGMKGTIYDQDYEEEHQQNIVDNLNLLYVAFTRASESLYIFGRRKASSASRSALIEKVLPTLIGKLEGSVLSGEGSLQEPLAFEYGVKGPQIPTAPKTPSPSSNPFLQESIPIKVNIGVFAPKTSFKQSNKSRDFVNADFDSDEQVRQKEYIQLGSVLHNVLSTIRTSNDVDDTLWQMEQDGILYNETLTRQHLTDLLRKRLSSPQVEEWFRLFLLL